MALAFVLAHTAVPPASAIEPVLRINGAGASTLVFSPDGRFLATADYVRAEVRVWDAATGKPVAAMKWKPFINIPGAPHGGIYELDWSRAAGLIAAGGKEDVLRLWDARTYREIAVLDCGGRFRSIIRALKFTPDGKRLLCGSQDGKLTVWDVKSRQAAASDTPRGGKKIRDLAVSPDGKLVATSDSGEIRLHDVASARLLRTFRVEARASPRVCFSNDGATLYTFSASARQPAVRALCIEKGDDKILAAAKDPGWAFAMSTDGRWLAYPNPERVVTLLDTTAPQRRLHLAGHAASVVALAFSSKQQLASSQGSILIWNLSAALKQADQLPKIKLPKIKD